MGLFTEIECADGVIVQIKTPGSRDFSSRFRVGEFADVDDGVYEGIRPNPAYPGEPGQNVPVNLADRYVIILNETVAGWAPRSKIDALEAQLKELHLAEEDPEDSPFVRQTLYTNSVRGMLASFVGSLFRVARPERVKVALEGLLENWDDRVKEAQRLDGMFTEQLGERSGWPGEDFINREGG